MEDVCIVCAEPLQFTAYGECGHKDACSKCVLRLRSVLKDPRCLYCQVGAAGPPACCGSSGRGRGGGMDARSSISPLVAAAVSGWGNCSDGHRRRRLLRGGGGVGEPICCLPPPPPQSHAPHASSPGAATCVQVPAEAVFVTRFMGDYTDTVPPDAFPGLPVSAGGVWVGGWVGGWPAGCLQANRRRCGRAPRAAGERRRGACRQLELQAGAFSGGCRGAPEGGRRGAGTHHLHEPLPDQPSLVIRPAPPTPCNRCLACRAAPSEGNCSTWTPPRCAAAAAGCLALSGTCWQRPCSVLAAVG